MRRPPLRRLLAGGAAEPDRIFHHHVWYRGHTNRRYAELVPRLERVDAYLLWVPKQRIPRGLVYRAIARSLGPRAALVRAGSRRYRSLFAAELEQVEHFSGPAVVDLDDPSFSDREAWLLERPNVLAYTVTARRAVERLGALGVEKPGYVVPQGSPPVDPARASAARRSRRPGELVLGYVAAWLLLDGDRGGGNPLYNVEHLLELWEEIRSRLPAARLWLVGEPSQRLRARLGRRDDVLLTGRLPPPDALAHAACFDVALYPRTADQGVRAVKIAEYLTAGVPTVAYDHEVVGDLRESAAGILVSSPREFAEAAVGLAQDEPARRALASAAASAGRQRDWDALAAQMAEILDRHLPFSASTLNA
jgi:glycosyltransferase involved in cell wall biosynthesis